MSTLNNIKTYNFPFLNQFLLSKTKDNLEIIKKIDENIQQIKTIYDAEINNREKKKTQIEFQITEIKQILENLKNTINQKVLKTSDISNSDRKLINNYEINKTKLENLEKENKKLKDEIEELTTFKNKTEKLSESLKKMEQTNISKSLAIYKNNNFFTKTRGKIYYLFAELFNNLQKSLNELNLLSSEVYYQKSENKVIARNKAEQINCEELLKNNNVFNFNIYKCLYQDFYSNTIPPIVKNSFRNLQISKQNGGDLVNKQTTNTKITDLYLIPELYIMYSKLYHAFQERQKSTFDFLDSYDSFYRLSQYSFSHENPNIRSINELIRNTAEKKKSNNNLILFDDYKQILTSVQEYQTENEQIILKITELVRTFKRIGERQKGNIVELKRKLTNLFTSLKTLFTNKTYFNTSNSPSTPQHEMFSTILKNSEYKNFINFFQTTPSFDNFNSLTNTSKIDDLTFTTLNNFLNNLKDELNDLTKNVYFDKDSKEIQTELAKRAGYLSDINKLKSIMEEISFLYFKIFKKNISSTSKNIINIYKILTDKESKFLKFNQIIQKIQAINSELNYDKSQNEKIMKNNILENYVSLKKEKNEEKKLLLEQKKNEIKTNIIDKKKKLINELNELSDELNKILILNIKNNVNSQNEDLIKFLSSWIKIVIKVKCIELNLIIKLIKENEEEDSICKSLKDYKLDQNLQMTLRNTIIETFNNINSYYTSFVEENKNQKETLSYKIEQLTTENTSIKDEPTRLKNEIDKEERTMKDEKSKYEGAIGKIKAVEPKISTLETKQSTSFLTSGESNTLSRHLSEKQTEETKRDEAERLLKDARTKRKDLLTQRLKVESRIEEIKKSKETLDQQLKNIEALGKELIKDGNEIRKDRLKDLVQNINKAYVSAAQVYGLTINFEKKAKELEKKSSQNELISLFTEDSLFKIMKRLISVDVINDSVRGTNIVEPNRTKDGLKRYRIILNKSVENFKTNTVPFLIKYYEEKLQYHNDRDSILSTFTFNVGNLSQFNQSSYKRFEPLNLEINSFLINLSGNSTTSPQSSSSSSSSKSQEFLQPNSGVSKYGQALYGGTNVQGQVQTQTPNPPNKNATPVVPSVEVVQKNVANVANLANKPKNAVSNKKNKQSIYLEAIDKKLDILKNKLSPNSNHQNRVNIFIKTIDEFDKNLSEKILEKLKKIQKMNNPIYKFIFAQQVRFIIRRFYKINEFIDKLSKISKENNSFNFVNTYYTTDLFLMYLSLNIVFYNFINCVQSKPPKNKLKMNY